MIAIPALAGVSGLILGSFLNVVVHRLPRRESLVRPRSRCPGCGTTIAARDNVPVLSWVLLRGRCRCCRTAISPRYPILEGACGVLFVAVVVVEGVSLDLVVSLPFAAVLLAVAVIDLDHRMVPNRILAPAAVYALVVGALVAPDELLPERLIAGAGAFVVLLAAALAYPGGMGMGDVKLAGVMGLFLGLGVVPALFVAFLTGTLVGVAVMVRKGAAARKSAVPFGPFLALGALVGLLAGPELIDAYTRAFLA